MSAQKVAAKKGGVRRSRSSQVQRKALSSFDGANHSESRGWIYFPTLDTRRELDTYTRLELIKKQRWFYANNGLARRCVNGAANMVGYMTPQAATTDKEWNAASDLNFESRAGSAQVFDLMGKNNFYSYQIALSRNRFKDGDILTALTKTSNGGAAIMPYEAHQVDNGSRRGSDWLDGVLTNGFGRHQAYSLLNGTGTFTISARDAIYYGDLNERLNAVRAPGCLTHAVNGIHDITEIVADAKLGIKSGNLVGIYKTRPGAATKATRMGAGRGTETVGTDPTRKITKEDIYQGGKLLDLVNGEELKTLQDTRPHPNQMNLLDFVIRDLAWGFGLSPEVLWFIGKVNGTTNRFMLADAAKWVEQEQQRLVDLFCTRYWVYHMACEMKAGRLPPCKDPEWWKVNWIPQERITVDRGRDGKLNIDLHRGSMLTLSRHYNMLGMDWKPEAKQWVDELKFIRDELAEAKIPLSDLPALLGAASANSSLDPNSVLETLTPSGNEDDQ